MNQSGHLNDSEETGTGCPVTSKYGRTPPNKHGCVGRQQHCGYTLHDVKHLFNCPAHPTTMTPSDLWSRPVDAIRELGYLEAGVLDWDEPDWKVNNNVVEPSKGRSLYLPNWSQLIHPGPTSSSQGFLWSQLYLTDEYVEMSSRI